MASYLTRELTKHQVDKMENDEMANWQKLLKHQIDIIASWQNGKLTKVVETSSWQNGRLTKCQVLETASC
jgi:hypothetical protein